MARISLAGLDRKRLRLWLALFFLVLAIPTGILVGHAYRQLRWEAFYQHRVLAEELARRIDDRFTHLIATEEARSFSDYTFLVLAGDPKVNFLQRSALSVFPVASTIPGLIGYFQVDTQGAFTTPLVPETGAEPMGYGISREELQRRSAVANRMQRILVRNRLVRDETTEISTVARSAEDVRSPPKQRLDQPAAAGAARSVAEAPEAESSRPRVAGALPPGPMAPQASGQAAFDRLSERSGYHDDADDANPLGRVEDLNLDPRFQAAAPPEELPQRMIEHKSSGLSERATRKERVALPERGAPVLKDAIEGDAAPPGDTQIRIHTFDSEIDPIDFGILDSGEFVLYRKVWRDGQRFVQGALIESQPFLDAFIQVAFQETVLSRMSDLVVAYRGRVLSAFTTQHARGYVSNPAELTGALLYQTRLSAPLSELALIFSITQLPEGPGSSIVTWLAGILVLVLCGGFYLMYRLGAGQIDLARQQQDFVSAVSHELKTPLTSIRMYGEILREGWAPEDKRKLYYDYIFDECQRLTRLINNILQLARMTRNDLQIEIKPITAAELMANLRSKVASQIERAEFELEFRCADDAADTVIDVDTDYFTQILINLVDNAVKFSAKSERRQIDIACQLQPDGRIRFSVRDYGPGVPKKQMKRIFKLFWRPESELTREAVGTGIGLALVRQLTQAMNGHVDVENKDPGAEFRVVFPTRSPSTVSAHRPSRDTVL